MSEIARVNLYELWEDIRSSGWPNALASTPTTKVFSRLNAYLEEQTQHNKVILPGADAIFNAFRYTHRDTVKVVILGQDPYPDIRFAHGLSFSVQPGVRIPGSLQNIFTELQVDLGGERRQSGYLVDWAEQGVLLLNTTLTVNLGEPGSHVGHGWANFTYALLEYLNATTEHLVFMLWGSHALKWNLLIDPKKHLILGSSHPSFRSYDRNCGHYPAFKGSRPFSQANAYLREYSKRPIIWG